jgi:exodeoxyribonuclease-3
MKLISWNVNGIRAVLKKGFLEWLSREKPDILCVQETKVHDGFVPAELQDVSGYDIKWSSGERKGYSGVASFFRIPPDNIEYGFFMGERFDSEGRIIISEHPGFTLLNIYFPNGQKNEERLRYKLDFYAATLEYCENLREKGRELVICGDVNTAHNEIDLARPEKNENVSGFLRIERDWLDKIEKYGYIDTFRKFHPDEVKYSWWSYRTAARKRNVGWRLDYFYITPGLLGKVKKAGIMNEVMGSDHCPVILELS